MDVLINNIVNLNKKQFHFHIMVKEDGDLVVGQYIVAEGTICYFYCCAVQHFSNRWKRHRLAP